MQRCHLFVLIYWRKVAIRNFVCTMRRQVKWRWIVPKIRSIVFQDLLQDSCKVVNLISVHKCHFYRISNMLNVHVDLVCVVFFWPSVIYEVSAILSLCHLFNFNGSSTWMLTVTFRVAGIWHLGNHVEFLCCTDVIVGVGDCWLRAWDSCAILDDEAKECWRFSILGNAHVLAAMSSYIFASLGPFEIPC